MSPPTTYTHTYTHTGLLFLKLFKAVEARYDIDQICTVRSILELVFIRSGYLEFSDTSNSTCIAACETEAVSYTHLTLPTNREV